MLLPPNAITFTAELIGISNQTVIEASTSSPLTVLTFHNQQSGLQSNTFLKCGSKILAKTYDRDYSLDLLNFVCKERLFLDKTGIGDNAFATVSYVNYDRTMSPEITMQTNAAALLWLVYLILFSASFFAVVYYFIKRFSK